VGQNGGIDQTGPFMAKKLDTDRNR
jgi:hypothetical protein